MLVGDLTPATINDGHEPSRDGLHHLAEHGLVHVHRPPGGHNRCPELGLCPWVLPLNLVLEDSPNLQENIDLSVSSQ